MKIVIDVDALQKNGVITESIGDLLRQHALNNAGSTAINILLALGAIAVAAGMISLIPHAGVAALFGLGFILLGSLVVKHYGRRWGKLGSIWMVVGALILCGSMGMLIDQPMLASLSAALILTWVSVLARSRLLMALVPFALAAAIGGSTGYWHACYAVTIEEPTLTIFIFGVLAAVSWEIAWQFDNIFHDLAIIFARVCVILVNFGFWIGSLWGDTPGHTWRAGVEPTFYTITHQTVPAWMFSIGWAMALVAAAAWGVKNNRRFMVNTAAVFGSIHLYTQWFEYLGIHPLSVILSGFAAIGLGLGLWHYNRASLERNA